MTLGDVRTLPSVHSTPPEQRPRTTVRAELLAIGPAIVVLFVFWGIAAHLQAGVSPMLRASVAVVVTQLLPGAVIWRAIRPSDGWLFEDIAFGLAMGGALAVPAQVVSVVAHASWLAGILPLACGAAILAIPACRRRSVQARWSRLPRWWGPASIPGLLAAMVASTNEFPAAMATGTGWSRQHPDMPYQLSMAGELAHRFPPHSPQFAALPLDYHWLANAWVAQIGVTSGSELDVVMFRFVPVLLGAVFPLMLMACTLRITRLKTAAPLAVLVAFLVGQPPIWTSPTPWVPLWPNSVSGSFSACLMCPLLVLLVARWRGELLAWTWWPAAFLALIAGGSKGSLLPVIFGGCCLALLAVWRQRRQRQRLLIDTATVAGALAVLMAVIFRGNGGGLKLTAFQGLINTTARLGPHTSAPHGIALVLVVVNCFVLVCIPWSVAVALVFPGSSVRADPGPWLLLGSAAAGIAGLSLFATLPANETWFRLSAQIPMAIALSWVLVAAAEHAPDRLLVVLAGAVYGIALSLIVTGIVRRHQTIGLTSQVVGLGIFLAAMLLLGLVFRRWKPGTATLALLAGGTAASCLAVPHWWAAPPAGRNEPVSVSSGQVATARYIRDHADTDAVIATNRHCTRPNPRSCDDRHFWYAAYTEHRMLLEGWAYTSLTDTTMPQGWSANAYRTQFWDPSLLRLNDDFFRHPSERAATKLWGMGVRWALVDRTVRGAAPLAPYATLQFSTPTAQAWRLAPPAS